MYLGVYICANKGSILICNSQADGVEMDRRMEHVMLNCEE